MTSASSDAARIRALENEIAQLRQEIQRLHKLLGQHARATERSPTPGGKAAATPVPPLVDRTVLDALAEATSRQTVIELIDMFAHDLPATIRSMRQAIAGGDARTLQNLAHPQVSVCHALGITSMSALARQLETLAESNQVATAQHRVDELERLLTRVEAELRDWVQPTTAPAAAAATAASAPTVHRVLVVEDNPVNLKIATSLLEGLGHQADTAGTGRAALEALERNSYSAVLMDVLLPGLDGLATTRAICRRWPPGQRPAIVGMSGLDAEADRRAGLDAGMDDYIVKPLTRHVLDAALRRFSIFPRAAVPEKKAVVTAPTVIQAPPSMTLDPTVLRHWSRARPAMAVELIDTFVEALQLQLDEIRRAIQGRDAARLRRAAHSLKSSSIGVGAVAMATLAAELEAEGRAGSMANVGPKVRALVDMQEPLTLALQTLRAEFAGGR